LRYGIFQKMNQWKQINLLFITNFIPKHPGGTIINNAKNKNLDEVLDKYNVSWHKTNPKVQNILEKYKMN
jgi:hypothetical protein